MLFGPGPLEARGAPVGSPGLGSGGRAGIRVMTAVQTVQKRQYLLVLVPQRQCDTVTLEGRAVMPGWQAAACDDLDLGS